VGAARGIRGGWSGSGFQLARIGPGAHPRRQLSVRPVITLELQIVIGFHMLFAAIFVGSNVFLDFLLTPRLDLIPPGQAARLADKLGVDFAILNFVALGGLPLTGLLLLWRLSTIGQLLTLEFYATGYGIALAVMMTIWLTLVVTAFILTFYLRPRVLVKLPYDATRQQVEDSRTQAIKYAGWMQWLARYNVIVSVLAVLMGGMLRFGGFAF
jgi:uncharacterized membrane protein